MKQMTVFGAKEIDELKDINISRFIREFAKFKFGEKLIEVYPIITDENKISINQREFNSEILTKYFKGYMIANKKVQKESILNLYKEKYVSLIIELKTGKTFKLKDKDEENVNPYIINVYSKKKKDMKLINNMDFIIINMKIIDNHIDLKLNAIVKDDLYNIFPEHIKLEDMKLQTLSLIKDVMRFFDEYTIELIKKSIENYKGECPILNGKKNLLDSLGLENKIDSESFVNCDFKNSYFMLT